MLFLYIIAIPIVICLGNFLIFRKRVTMGEILFQVGGILLIMAISVFGCSAGKKSDTEVLNGTVTSKARHEVGCRHSYKCHCYTTTDCYGSGKDRHCSTTEHCQTCYDHAYDVDWDVYANYGMSNTDFSVSTIDRQGLKEPPRWTQFAVGDPYMTTHGYDNYVKANAETIYKTHGYQIRYKNFIPAYPMSISDYHTRLDRVVVVGNVVVPDIAAWNADLTNLNKVIGPKKQCNIVIIMTPGLSEEYYYALKEAWIGGKKNDIIVIIDVATDGSIKWSNTLSWAKEDMVRVKLRDDIMAIGKLDRVAIIKVIGEDVDKYFRRKSMKEYKYLDKAIILSDNEFMWLFIFAIMLSIGISVLVDMVDFEGGSGSFSSLG